MGVVPAVRMTAKRNARMALFIRTLLRACSWSSLGGARRYIRCSNIPPAFRALNRARLYMGPPGRVDPRGPAIAAISSVLGDTPIGVEDRPRVAVPGVSAGASEPHVPGRWDRAPPEEVAHDGRPGVRLAERGKNGGVPPDLAQDRDVAGDHGRTAGQRFDDREAEALGLARDEDHRRASIQLGEVRARELGRLDQGVADPELGDVGLLRPGQIGAELDER